MFNPSLWSVREFTKSVPEMMNLQREINRLFSNVGQTTTLDYPAINVWEKDDRIIVTSELPGFDPENIDVSVTDKTLTFSGVNKVDSLKEGQSYLRQEREWSDFRRSIKLPFQVDSQTIEAKYEKGILQISLSKLKEALPKKIKINS